MKKIPLVSSLLLLMASCAFCQDGPFKFGLKADKHAYRPGESIEFTLVLDNLSRGDKYCYIDDLYNAACFKVADGSGRVQETARTVVYDAMAAREGYKLIKAKSSYSWKIRAGVEKRDGNIVLNFGDSETRLKGAGKYTLVGTYTGWSGNTFGIDKEDIFDGTLFSGAIILDIITE